MGNVERETNTHKGWYSNIETMTGKGRELADMMERRNVQLAQNDLGPLTKFPFYYML